LQKLGDLLLGARRRGIGSRLHDRLGGYGGRRYGGWGGDGSLRLWCGGLW
jgi:hypothetical protein